MEDLRLYGQRPQPDDLKPLTIITAHKWSFWKLQATADQVNE